MKTINSLFLALAALFIWSACEDDADKYYLSSLTENELIAPENAVYSWENEPTGQGPVTYVPYYTGPGEISDVVMSARLNTMRLLNRSGWDYKFIIRDANTEAEVWSYNLMTLLSIARPVSRYDGTELPFQEYLDRQSEWNLIFTVVEKPGGGFLQIGIVVGTWIHWLHGMEV